MNRKSKPKTHYTRPRPKSHGPKGPKYLKPKPLVLTGVYHAAPQGYGLGTNAPEVCPVCNHPQSYFEVHAENY